ncbi:MAG: ECF transporter S component [Armatimonadota bacterium]|nr:ECF transporter S component [Armatimonadota bacterium]MDR7495011.1 ECF transporter S component [Armatimonadota bacterium]MDR7548054.1 ECF transporter S component [Armatimonadota bacterium]
MRRFTQVAVLGAIAFTFMSFDFPLPLFPAWLKYDPGEVPALVATFALGPTAGVAVELIKGVLISLFRPGGLGGPFGIFMNLLAGVTLVAVAGIYYRIEHTRRGALKAMGFGILAMTAVMIAANIALTPIFFGLPRPQVMALVLPALLPFNLVKGLISCAATYYVYKRVRVYLYEWIADRAGW